MSIMAKEEMLACVEEKCGARYSADDWDDGDDDDEATQGGPCKNWCATHKKAWRSKCKWKKCSGCSACLTGPCVDNDEEVKKLSGGKASACTAVSSMCHNSQIGDEVRLHCPKT